MADENLERITILLQARDRDFARAMDRNNKLIARMSRDAARNTDTMSRRIDSNLSKVSASVMNFGKAFAGGLVGGAVAAAFSGFSTNIAGVIRGIAQVGDEAKRSGLGLQAFQEWKFVAEQNRIGVDQLVDGFKELNLRADEFIATGAGPAAEAFARLGLTGAALGEKLKDPSALMLEIVDRLEEMDKAAQIRIADEVFGGTAGERFVELLEQGDEGLRQTIARAHEVGAVMDREMIEKAADLDRRFSELTTTLGNAFKQGVVAAADFFAPVQSEADRLLATLQEIEKARPSIGNDAASELAASPEAAALAADSVADLAAETEVLTGAAAEMALVLSDASMVLRGIGDQAGAQLFAALSQEVSQAASEFRDGKVSADDFRTILSSVETQASDTADMLDAIDNAAFAGVIARLGTLLDVIRQTAGAAASAARNVNAISGVDMGDERGRTGNADNFVRVLPYDPNTSGPRPTAAPSGIGGIDWGLPPASRGGSGGSSRPDDFQRDMERTAQQIAALEAEAAAFIAVAAAGDEYAWSVDFARKKAELLVAAQQAGKEITPELAAQIDNMARAYADAGNAADQAADDFDKVRENAERGADAMADIFSSVISGAKSAREAVADLLAEMARASMQKAFANLATAGGGGGVLGWLGGLLGGARAGVGAVSAGTPYLVNENTPNSEVFVPSRSGGVLNVAQAKDALAGAGGGGNITIAIDARGSVEGEAERFGRVLRAAMPGLRDQLLGEVRNKRARGYGL